MPVVVRRPDGETIKSAALLLSVIADISELIAVHDIMPNGSEWLLCPMAQTGLYADWLGLSFMPLAHVKLCISRRSRLVFLQGKGRNT